MINHNTGKLIGFTLRRDWLQSILWLVCLLSIILLMPPVYQEMYRDNAGIEGLIITMQNPAIIAICGPVYGADHYTTGAMVSNAMLLFAAALAGMMNIFFVVRYTRKEEEQGRTEVIRSLPVGRLSALLSTLVVAVLLNLILAGIAGVGLAAFQIESMDFAGSVLFGAVVGVTGLFFAALTAVFAQLCAGSKGTMGYSFAAMGLFYLLRAAGDMDNELLACLSPLGLILRTQTYVENNWWPILIMVLATAVLAGLSLWLNTRRDMDQGFIPQRAGRTSASPLLSSSIALSFRLVRGTLIGWGIGLFMIAIAYGSIMGDLESFVAENEMLSQMMALNDQFTANEMYIAMLMSIIAVFCSIPVMITVLKLRAEEKRNYLEHVMSRAVSRNAVLGGYILIALATSVLMFFLSALGLWAGSTPVLAEPISFLFVIKALAVFLPAVWFIMGLAVFFIGALPSLTGVIWGYLGFSFFVVYMGKMIDLPEFINGLSVFYHIPQLPVDEIHVGVLALLTVLAMVLTGIGVFTFRKRDLQG